MELSHLHFQLTQACNLRCPFCGQTHRAAGELSTAQWEKLIAEAAAMSSKPKITFWGGESLLYRDFDHLVNTAHAAGLELELITNGTLLAGHETLLKRLFRRIYISVDGPETVHDAIRGHGVFARVRENILALRGGDAELVIMGVLSPETMATAAEAPYGLAVDRVIFHQLIYLTPEEAQAMHGGEVWVKNDSAGYTKALAATLEVLRKTKFPVPAEFQKHGVAGTCREPWRHLHITSVGECGFCTDFTEYTIGNVRDHSLMEIFTGAAAEAMRQKIISGQWYFCQHCAWKNNDSSIEQFR